MAVKRTLKRAAGKASLMLAPFASGPVEHAVCVLAYHRIADIGFTDTQWDSWNVRPEVFEQHMAALAGWAEFVPLQHLPLRVATDPPVAPRPRVCITFDDGFASVCRDALPILERFGIPATAFVVTNYVGSEEPMAFDGWSRRNAGRAPLGVWRPMNWTEIEQCVASGLVTIGAHSHQHLDGRCCTPGQLTEEAGVSRTILQHRLGDGHATSYAYPYGSTRLGEVPACYVDAVKTAGYQRAVTTDLGLTTERTDPFALPRVEAAGVDSPAVIRAKVRGSLMPLHLTDRLRSARRSA